MKERMGGERIGSGLRSLAGDCAFGLRQFRRAPAFTAVAVLTLALGIGANTAVFSIVQGVMLSPLPYEEPDRLVLVWLYNRTLKTTTYLSFSDYVDWRREARSFERMAAFTQQDVDLTNPGTAEHLDGKRVSAGFFGTLGVQMAAGREFTSSEDVPGGAPVAVISDRLWRERFGGSRQETGKNAIGKALTLDGVAYTVAGVLPRSFRFLTAADVYLPLGQGDSLQLGDRATHNVACVARLARGVGAGQAQAEMSTLQAEIDRLHPKEERGLGAQIEPLKQEVTGDVGRTLFLLLGAVGVVLLIACANVSSLLLERSAGRAREFAIRSALGANRTRIVRQLVTESVMLSVGGGALGVAMANWGVAALLAMIPGALPRSENIRVNAAVLVFAMAVSIGVAILFGLAPALRIAGVDLQTSLKAGGRHSAGGYSRAQSALVIGQMALTLVLLVGAGLLVSTVRHLWDVNPGFDSRHVLTFKVGLAPSIIKRPARIRNAYRQLMERLRSLPGVQAADVTTLVPLSGNDDSLPFWSGPREPASLAEAPRVLAYSAGPDYLKVMGIPLLRGRFFTLNDTNESAPVVVIDSNLARKFFPDRDPVGQTLTFVHVGSYRVIGVVGHVRHWGLDDAARDSRYQTYSSIYQISDQWLPIMYPDVTVAVRTPLGPATLMPAIEAAIHEAGGDQPVYDIRSMQQLASDSMSQRFPMMLMAAFAGLALVLAAAGVYGVIACSVADRVREIGIRLALGAERSDILGAVLGRGLRLALTGIGIGGVIALVLARLVSSFSRLLYGVDAGDPVTFASVAALLIGVTLLASYVPARRAMRVDPIKALRQE